MVRTFLCFLLFDTTTDVSLQLNVSVADSNRILIALNLTFPYWFIHSNSYTKNFQNECNPCHILYSYHNKHKRWNIYSFKWKFSVPMQHHLKHHRRKSHTTMLSRIPLLRTTHHTVSHDTNYYVLYTLLLLFRIRTVFGDFGSFFLLLTHSLQRSSKKVRQIYIWKISISVEIKLCFFPIELCIIDCWCRIGNSFDASWDGVSSWSDMGTMGSTCVFNIQWIDIIW